MHRIRSLLVLLPALSLALGCSKTEPALTAAELQAARRAMPISEVSLMVRSGYNQNQIIAEIERRRVPAAIDKKIEESLVRSGAKPPLIAALTKQANALTRRQKRAFDELAATRDVASQREVAAETERLVAEQFSQERDQQQITKASVVATTKTQAESPEETYWKAEAAYRAKKSELEARVTSQQAYINRMRGRGYHQSDLASAEDRLHQYEDELKNLQAPIR